MALYYPKGLRLRIVVFAVEKLSSVKNGPVLDSSNKLNPGTIFDMSMFRIVKNFRV